MRNSVKRTRYMMDSRRNISSNAVSGKKRECQSIGVNIEIVSLEIEAAPLLSLRIGVERYLAPRALEGRPHHYQHIRLSLGPSATVLSQLCPISPVYPGIHPPYSSLQDPHPVP